MVSSESAAITGTGDDEITDAGCDDQSASVDMGDDKDDGAIEGPTVSAYVNIARKVCKYKVNLSSLLLIKQYSLHTNSRCTCHRASAAHISITSSSISL